MIKFDEIKKNEKLWMIPQSIDEMLFPKIVFYEKRESEKSDKSAFVFFNNKEYCHPTHLLFKTKKEALIYGSINYLKLYYSFDPILNIDAVDDELLDTAIDLIKKYRNEEPDLFLYHFMGEPPKFP